ncbi:MAG: hypothetical protein B7733_02950 [Myxococcales bacterium FL481]|nr:MAG: hypothetical protein B7733_02950 [Myxococcales bacterium FL481]
MELLRQTYLLARNDLRQELRNFEMVVSAVFFTFTVLLMFLLAFSTLKAEAHRQAVPAFLWVALAMAGTLTLSRVFEREREADTLTAMLAGPVDGMAVYAAKVTATLVVLLLCAAVLVPGLAVAFAGARPLLEHGLESIALVTLGCLGYASVGTLFAGGLAMGRGKNVLLSLILYPLAMPVLLYALVATQRLIDDHPDFGQTLLQMLALDFVFLVVASLLFESVLVGVRPRNNRPAKDPP